MNTTHVGQAIAQKVKERGLSISYFAKLINRSRQDVYYIFKQQYIYINELQIISNVLKHDFVSDFCQVSATEQKYQITVEVNEQKKEEMLSDKSHKIVEIKKL